MYNRLRKKEEEIVSDNKSDDFIILTRLRITKTRKRVKRSFSVTRTRRIMMKMVSAQFSEVQSMMK
jgi:hypothetical protein